MQPLTMSRQSAQRLAAHNQAAAPARSCRRRAHGQHPTTSKPPQPSQLLCRAADMPDPAEQQQQQQQKQRPQSQQQQQLQQQEEEQQQRRFQELLAELQQLPFQELQQLCDDSDASHAAFSATFLFWLSAQEKAAGGQQKQALASLAAQLVYLKEAADAAASRRLLPSLASSLAYSNYSSWRQQHPGQDLPDVAPGVSLTQLLKAAEREEARLKQSWQSPQRPASSLDSFADVSGYKQLAAQAIERARARFRGYEDDDDDDDAAAAAGGGGGASAQQQQQQQRGRASPAAEAALQELLVGCCCREERATVLPQAFLPPGLQVSAGSDGRAQGPPARVVTTPQRMLAAIQERLGLLQGAALPAAGGPAAALALRQQAAAQEQLPSGELLQQVLRELREDVEEYERHVYRRMSARDLYDRM